MVSRRGRLGPLSPRRDQTAGDATDVGPLAVGRQPHPAREHAAAVPAGRAGAAAARAAPRTAAPAHAATSAAPGGRAPALGRRREAVHPSVPRDQAAETAAGVGQEHEEAQHRI